MARKPHPWYRDDRAAWYVTVAGQRHKLGEHPAGAATPKQSKKTGLWNAPESIMDAFHKLMGQEEPPAPPPPTPYISVCLQKFLTWDRANRAPKTHERYFDFLDSFERRWHGLLMADLTADHVQEWLNEKPSWNSTTRRNAITALQRAFNWCVKNAGLSRNPIKGMEKPAARRRTGTLTAEELAKLLEQIPDQRFQDLLIVSFDTGARPQEIKRLEARHVDLANELVLIPTEEAKGKRRPRVIYIPTPRCLAILARLTTQHPSGPLFRNRLGNAWTGMAVKNRFEDLDHVLGRRVTQYDFRRTWITNSLLAGVDSHVVAQLAGHADTKMIDTHYSRVADNHQFMREMAKRGITVPDASTPAT